ncbi:MAG: GHMP kinase [Bacteroidetes bacterium]|nr:GHMP kinase [Bacteroidota bacterium]
MKKTYYSNGKLLLTGEYLVLDGALSLAVPTQFGQSLTVETIDERKLIWKSLDKKRNIWFEDEFNILDKISLPDSYRDIRNDNDVSIRLLQILNATKQLNPGFLSTQNGFAVTTKLDFPQFWGLGSSSTLINNIAQWEEIDPYQLLKQTFGGSGYDIACAQHNVPITFQLKNEFTDEILKQSRKLSGQNDTVREILKVDFTPIFKDHLFFVHLNKKQNSRDGIKHYNANKNNSVLAISEISDITSKMIKCANLTHFETLITSHENIISKIIKQKPVKELLFNDYNGAIKSLGAWGGDFVLVTGNKDSISYFRNKGYHTIIPYSEMVLK